MLPLEPLSLQPSLVAGEHRFAAVAFDRHHVKGMCRGLVAARGESVWVAVNSSERMKALSR